MAPRAISIDAPRPAPFTTTRVLGIAAFALLTAVGAMIRIPLPFTPVPVTLQTLFVVLAGIYLGGRDGALSQVAYVTLGAAGVPWFAASGGGGALLGATGGFLVSFPIAAWIVGTHLQPGHSLKRSLVVLGLANVVIFALGASWFAAVLGTSASRTATLAVLPFLPGAAVKTAVAAALVVRAPFQR